VKVVIAGGGTGGHLFPGVALADAFLREDASSIIVFMGADRGLEVKVIPSLGFELITFPVGGVVGAGLLGGIFRSLSLAAGVIKATGALRRISPDLVVGTGGYGSVPGVLAAALLRIQRSIMEQNVTPGRANRFLARLVPRIYLGLPTAEGVFPSGKAVLTGNPIRKNALIGTVSTRGDTGNRKTLLVLGGSQGAVQLNDISMKIVPELLVKFPELRVIHQTGTAHSEKITAHYRAEGVQVEVVPFMERIGEYYQAADLCLSRAGAMAVSELAAAGLPSVLVPYPHAAGGHQKDNAMWLVNRGGAVLVEPDELVPEILIGKLENLIRSPMVLSRMAENARKAGTRDAAGLIVSEEMKRMSGGTAP